MNMIFENITEICKGYFQSIGVSESTIDEILNEENFSKGFVTPLAPVCVIKDNRPLDYKTKQTHIHITGDTMRFFYDIETLETVESSTDDEELDLKILNLNIDQLLHIRNARKNSLPIPVFHNYLTENLVSSNTVKKISKRSNERPQVQISKKMLDGTDFSNLREGLFPGDLIVFLKYKNNFNLYLVVGIPSTYLTSRNLTIETPLLESREEHLVDDDNKESFPGVFQIALRSVTPDNIANFNTMNNEDSDEDNANEGKFDLSDGIKTRKQRTERHQVMVKKLAFFLDNLGYTLYEGNIDCLAYKENMDTLIFEAKTLDSTASDEAKQVRGALGQLIYYEFFATKEFENTIKQKIAFFESKITDDHIKLFLSNNCLVIWLNDEGNFDGTEASLNFIRNLQEGIN